MCVPCLLAAASASFPFLNFPRDNNPILESLWKWYGNSNLASFEKNKGSAFLVVGKDQWLAISRGYHIVIDLTTTAAANCYHAVLSSRKVVPRRWRELLYSTLEAEEKALRLLSAAFTFWAGHIPRYVGQHSKLLGYNDRKYSIFNNTHCGSLCRQERHCERSELRLHFEWTKVN